MRHYGLLHGVQRRKKLRRVRQLLGVESNQGAVEITTDDLIKQLTGIDPQRCPVCGVGKMVAIGELPLCAGSRSGEGEGWYLCCHVLLS